MTDRAPNPQRAFFDAFVRMEDIALRMGTVLNAIDFDLCEMVDTPAAKPINGALKQVLGLVQVLHDYQAEPQKCHDTANANQPDNLFPA